MSVDTKPDEDWMTKKWRPMMALMYMAVCIMDFVVFPIMFTAVQFWETAIANDAFRQWVPITLQSGGLFHVAMGAVLGVTAYGRTQEKVACATNTSTNISTSVSTTHSVPQTVPTSVGPAAVPTSVEPVFRPATFALQAEPISPPAMSAGRRPVTPNFNL
jgi:hypothetical protein